MIAQQLPEEDIQEFKTMFVKLDKNGDGFLSRLEFKDVFDELGNKGAINISDEDVEGLYSSLDLNGSGNIDYTEFLAAFTNNEHYKKEKYLKSVFKKIDKVSLEQIKKNRMGTVN
jgi:calcium-dependent protein kinase